MFYFKPTSSLKIRSLTLYLKHDYKVKSQTSQIINDKKTFALVGVTSTLQENRLISTG